MLKILDVVRVLKQVDNSQLLDLFVQTAPQEMKIQINKGNYTLICKGQRIKTTPKVVSLLTIGQWQHLFNGTRCQATIRQLNVILRSCNQTPI